MAMTYSTAHILTIEPSGRHRTEAVSLRTDDRTGNRYACYEGRWRLIYNNSKRCYFKHDGKLHTVVFS